MLNHIPLLDTLTNSIRQNRLKTIAGNKANFALFNDQNYKLPMSCSIGIALSPEHGRSYYELFNKADQALYWAKAKGKNNFVIYNEENEKLYYHNAKASAVNNRIDVHMEKELCHPLDIRRYYRQFPY